MVSIPFEQGDVFRLLQFLHLKNYSSRSQSLSSRAMSFDDISERCFGTNPLVSIPFEQGDVFRPSIGDGTTWMRRQSQSLSSRAMSFDNQFPTRLTTLTVSIPFEQGDVFRQLNDLFKFHCSLRLNPFRAGRCLSTILSLLWRFIMSVSIPFEQGDVFRRSLCASSC